MNEVRYDRETGPSSAEEARWEKLGIVFSAAQEVCG